MNPRNRKPYKEIESVISEHPKVAEVKVMNTVDESGEEVIKALISMKEPSTFKEITDWCCERLDRCDVPKLMEIKSRPIAPCESLLDIKEIKNQKDYICMTMPYRKEITNIHGIIYGGVISLLADNAIGVLVNVNYGPCYTRKMEIEFFQPAKTDLSVEAKTLKKKLNLCICEAEVKDKEGELIAKASARIFVL